MRTNKIVTAIICFVVALPFLPQSAQAQSSGAPALPQVFLNTQLVTMKGRKTTVQAGGNLQAAIDAARPGDTILVAAGATFVGNFVLPAKSGTDPILIRTTASDSALPGPGVRVGPSNAALMPKLLSPNSFPALATSGAAHN